MVLITCVGFEISPGKINCMYCRKYLKKFQSKFCNCSSETVKMGNLGEIDDVKRDWPFHPGLVTS